MSNDVDDLLGEDKPAKKAAKAAPAKKTEAKPAKKAAKEEAKPAKKAAKPEAKAAPAKKAAKPEAKPAKKAAKKAEAADPSESNSAVVQALMKVKKATTYADFAEKNDFNIRSVRRSARALRDAGHIELERDGQTVYIKPAV